MKGGDMQVMYGIDMNSLLDYVEGTASEDTRKRVDQYLDENEEERLVINGIRTYYQEYGVDRQALLTFLQESRTASLAGFQQHITKKRALSRWMGWAAVLLLMGVGMVAYLFFGKSGNAQSSVIAYLADPYPVTVFLSNQPTGAWVAAYQDGNYQQASVLLKNTLQNGQDNAMLKYYTGLSYLYQHPRQPAHAITYLSQVKEGALAQQADWYLALAYLLENNEEEAQPLLQQIVDTRAFRHEAAVELLDRIALN